MAAHCRETEEGEAGAYILGSDWTKSVHGNLMSAITTPCQRRGVENRKMKFGNPPRSQGFNGNPIWFSVNFVPWYKFDTDYLG